MLLFCPVPVSVAAAGYAAAWAAQVAAGEMLLNDKMATASLGASLPAYGCVPWWCHSQHIAAHMLPQLPGVPHLGYGISNMAAAASVPQAFAHGKTTSSESTTSAAFSSSSKLMGDASLHASKPQQTHSVPLSDTAASALVAGCSRTGVARVPHRQARLWLHIHLHMQAPDFDLVPMLIGRGGCNMKRIAEKTGAKLRVRGRGSGHLEIDSKREAPTPLMVAVTTEHVDHDGFREAARMTLKELDVVSRRFQQHCKKKQLPCSGPFFSLGNLSAGANETLRDLLEGVPVQCGKQV